MTGQHTCDVLPSSAALARRSDSTLSLDPCSILSFAPVTTATSAGGVAPNRGLVVSGNVAFDALLSEEVCVGSAEVDVSVDGGVAPNNGSSPNFLVSESAGSDMIHSRSISLCRLR